VLSAGIDPDTFWYSPYSSVERIYEGQLALDAWKNNPQER